MIWYMLCVCARESIAGIHGIHGSHLLLLWIYASPVHPMHRGGRPAPWTPDMSAGWHVLRCTGYVLLIMMSQRAHMPVPVMMHGHGGHRGCPLAYATYRTSSHPVELWATSWIRGPISCLSSWGDVLDPSTGGSHHGSMDPSGDAVLGMVMSYVTMRICTTCIVMGSGSCPVHHYVGCVVLSSIP